MSDTRDGPDQDQDQDSNRGADDASDTAVDASPVKKRSRSGPRDTGGRESLSEAESPKETTHDDVSDAGPTPSTAAETPGQPVETEPEPTPEHEDKEWCQETVDQATRQEVLRRDGHRCQFCGEAGPGAGGSRTLEVHHIDRAPTHCEVHDLENLTTLCENCHSWMHKRPTAEDVPVELSEADREALLPYDYQILRVLAMRGPATVGETVDHLYPQHARTAVRERLWTLMALDTIVPGRDQQLIDQDAHSGVWALCRPGEDSPVTVSARGHIPEDDRTLQTRVEDELVRQALAQGCHRTVLAKALGITERTTWHKERRAQAYDIPLEAVSRGAGSAQGAGHRVPSSDDD